MQSNKLKSKKNKTGGKYNKTFKENFWKNLMIAEKKFLNKRLFESFSA